VPDALERLVNLAMYLASVQSPVTAEQVRTNVDGYPEPQDGAAFRRMFERDKDDLREAGFVIVSDGENSYRLDPAATFANEIELTAAEAATIRVVGSAFLGDVSFPFASDLRPALAKLATGVTADLVMAASRLAEEQPSTQATTVALFDDAISARKRVAFDYVNALGAHKRHQLEPFGLFIRDGRWYLAGRDCDLDEIRVYAVTRTETVEVNAARPKTPDFERPEEFDVRSYIGLPFQYGSDSFDARVVFGPSQAWRASALTGGFGTLAEGYEGAVVWNVEARDPERLMRWIVENGPDITLSEPAALAEALHERFAKVAVAHG
jgi:predicted DNA-binding transcriptional regulator YafY